MKHQSIKFIAHRGNTKGPDKVQENHPDYISYAIGQGYDCEVDIWIVKNKIFLGHNEPLYSTNEDFINKNGLWLHAKNLEALVYILKNNLVGFWHENDRYTLTSNGFIWANIGMPITEKTILVSLDNNTLQNVKGIPYGICSDFVPHWYQQ